ncbi:hypothetical protein C8J57DRAFT_1240150 [Mycena rebaudengoi]|nr:hypothetical protein C8J57DRAFT_1240150 [Mycena rebaudengoi]
MNMPVVISCTATGKHTDALRLQCCAKALQQREEKGRAKGNVASEVPSSQIQLTKYYSTCPSRSSGANPSNTRKKRVRNKIDTAASATVAARRRESMLRGKRIGRGTMAEH